MKIKDTGNSIEVSIEGEEYTLLQRIADAMNKTPWADSDNSPESVFTNFVICWIEDFFDEPGRMAEDILSAVDTGYDDKDPMHRKRRGEMEAAFKSAGLLG